jgi:hypothetical protein
VLIFANPDCALAWNVNARIAVASNVTGKEKDLCRPKTVGRNSFVFIGIFLDFPVNRIQASQGLERNKLNDQTGIVTRNYSAIVDECRCEGFCIVKIVDIETVTPSSRQGGEVEAKTTPARMTPQF